MRNRLVPLHSLFEEAFYFTTIEILGRPRPSVWKCGSVQQLKESYVTHVLHLNMQRSVFVALQAHFSFRRCKKLQAAGVQPSSGIEPESPGGHLLLILVVLLALHLLRGFDSLFDSPFRVVLSSVMELVDPKRWPSTGSGSSSQSKAKDRGFHHHPLAGGIDLEGQAIVSLECWWGVGTNFVTAVEVACIVALVAMQLVASVPGVEI